MAELRENVARACANREAEGSKGEALEARVASSAGLAESELAEDARRRQLVVYARACDDCEESEDILRLAVSAASEADNGRAAGSVASSSAAAVPAPPRAAVPAPPAAAQSVQDEREPVQRQQGRRGRPRELSGIAFHDRMALLETMNRLHLLQQQAEREDNEQ